MLKEILREWGAVKIGRFILTSGKESKYYVDIKKACTNPKILTEIVNVMSKHIVDVDRIAGMELGAVPIITALSLKIGIPYIVVRKEERIQGTGKRIEGEVKPGERVIIVEDVTTTGSSVLKSVNILRDAGAIVEKTVVVVDREEGAKELLGKSNVKLITMVRVSELL